jgi:hypothetical protein
MRSILFLCSLVVICTGCPEPRPANRIVSVNFPSQVSPSKVSPSVSDSEIKEAATVIDEALVSNGFVRDSNPPEKGMQGFIATYSRFNSEGLIRLSDNPLVWLHDGRLEVVFSEGRIRGGDVSATTKATIEILRTALATHYGSKRVKVGHGRD